MDAVLRLESATSRLSGNCSGTLLRGFGPKERFREICCKKNCPLYLYCIKLITVKGFLFPLPVQEVDKSARLLHLYPL